MGFLSNILGGNKEDKALREALGQIQRILEDEKFQLDMKARIESHPAYDRDPDGTGPFGFSESNPIPVSGPHRPACLPFKAGDRSGRKNPVPSDRRNRHDRRV
jgi:hypothetical protein